LVTVEAMAFACGTLPVWPMMTMKRPLPWSRINVARRRTFFTNASEPDIDALVRAPYFGFFFKHGNFLLLAPNPETILCRSDATGFGQARILTAEERGVLPRASLSCSIVSGRRSRCSIRIGYSRLTNTMRPAAFPQIAAD
jgi:hypothetical protein